MSNLVLVADDDELLRAHIAAALRAAGFVVVDVADGADALRQARALRFDLIVLDRAMAGVDGMTVLRTLREENCDSPIMFLTASGQTSDKVRGLEAGADDYLAKPFDDAELLARVRALVRRPARLATHEISAGEVRLDLDARRAFVADIEAPVTAQDFAILETLVRNPGRAFTRDALLLRLGAAEDTSPAAIEHAVSRLRKKIADAAGMDVIETVRGLGYRLRG
jgi:two-component system OmpR family response regulator